MSRMGHGPLVATALLVVCAHGLVLVALHGTGPTGAGVASTRIGKAPSSLVHAPAPQVWAMRTLTTGSAASSSSSTPYAPVHAPADVLGAPLPSPYLPRTLLTTGPQPLAPIVIDYPPQLETVGSHTGELALYIDEHGVVTRVETLTQDLPPPMAIAARLAFQQARFRPGERDGVPVRARIVVEVRFDASASGDAAAPPLPNEPAAALAPPLGLPRS